MFLVGIRSSAVCSGGVAIAGRYKKKLGGRSANVGAFQQLTYRSSYWTKYCSISNNRVCLHNLMDYREMVTVIQAALR